MPMLVPRALSTAAAIAVYGGAMTMSQCFAPEASGTKTEKNTRVSACVLNIFQLPAITRRRFDELIIYYLLVSASTPGSLRPPRNSREAPPPVEMCEILLATPDWCTAATESPPPTIDVAPHTVAAATALATSSVPLANDGISNTPIGPFHTIVLAFAISAAYAAIVFGPISRPI